MVLARSITFNITSIDRGAAVFRYPSIFVSKLNDAESKAAETQTWIEIAHRCGYLSKDDAVDLEKRCEEIISQLVAMISHPEKWTINSSFWSSRS